MINWLLVIILAYFFFALSGIGDKLVLAGPPKPKQYTFFVGLLSFLVVFAIPFVQFSVPNAVMFFWIIVDAVVFMMAMYFGFKAVERFEISKVAVTIGATQPIFIFIISWIFFGYQSLSVFAVLAFIFLLAGSILISCDKKIEFNAKYFQLTLLSSVLYSLDYVISKLIYNDMLFAEGFIWRGIFIGIVALFFLFSKKNRQEILKKQKSKEKQKKIEKIFLATQVCGGTANILQAFAISLAPVAFLPIVNSLKGLQYIFIFIITGFFSYFFPKIFK
jgi:drug/metabolite transporter (DMT)-like permease